MKIYQYFLIGLKSTWNDNFFKTVAFIVGTIVLVTMVRKLIIVSRSGGKFSEPMHISNGNLYIHSGFVPGSREIPLKDLAEVEIYFVRGVHLNGDRYFIQFVRKKGRRKVTNPKITNLNLFFFKPSMSISKAARNKI